MRPVDIKDLVTVLTTICLLALAIGQFDKLHAFAKKEAIRSLKGWPVHSFFPKKYSKSNLTPPK